MSEAARRAAERAARTSYGRLLALVAARSRDVVAAEDALADAFAAALATWPVRGVPENPDAWLLTAARRAVGHVERGRKVRADAAHVIDMLYAEADSERGGLPDRRLELMFVCAHPAIDAGVRTPLMLQAVLGLDAARIAAAFLVAPATMSQRLVRAKTKIRDAGIAFEAPDPEALEPRLGDVLDAIYAAYGVGWDALPGADAGVRGLAEEAIFLARLAVALVPDAPEAKGLLALMLYCDARAPARRTLDGRFVPLAEQDPGLWSGDRVIEAEALLTDAAQAGVFGRYQCEAAIQSVHIQRGVTGHTHWRALVTLYDLLAERAPSLGVLVARAAALAESGDAETALAALDALPADRIAGYQPYWVTRARALTLKGLSSDDATARAIGLTEDPAVRAYLLSGADASPRRGDGFGGDVGVRFGGGR